MLALTKTDKIFWLRVGLGGVVGVLSDVLFWSDFESAVLFAIVVYLGSYYLVRRVWGKQFAANEVTKMYTAGVGSFTLLFIFLYIFLFTYGLHYLAL
jgi:hypothetical protein